MLKYRSETCIDVDDNVGRIELLPFVVRIGCSFPPHADVQSNPRIEVVVVLRVNTDHALPQSPLREHSHRTGGRKSARRALKKGEERSEAVLASNRLAARGVVLDSLYIGAEL